MIGAGQSAIPDPGGGSLQVNATVTGEVYQPSISGTRFGAAAIVGAVRSTFTVAEAELRRPARSLTERVMVVTPSPPTVTSLGQAPAASPEPLPGSRHS